MFNDSSWTAEKHKMRTTLFWRKKYLQTKCYLQKLVNSLQSKLYVHGSINKWLKILLVLDISNICAEYQKLIWK